MKSVFCSDDVAKHVSAVGTQFKENVKKLVRASERLDGALSDVKCIEYVV